MQTKFGDEQKNATKLMVYRTISRALVDFISKNSNLLNKVHTLLLFRNCKSKLLSKSKYSETRKRSKLIVWST